MVRERNPYLDVLKVLLIMLVIAHHAGQSYNQAAFWYYKDATSTRALNPFFSVNAAFFMSLFFLISAYLLPASFDRKGAARFLRDRFLRLGIPLVFGLLFFIAPMMYEYYLHFRDYAPISFPDYFIQVFLGFGPKPAEWKGPAWPDLQFGHLWFLEHLLIYAVLYTLWRKIVPRRTPSVREHGYVPGHLGLLLFVLVLSIVTYVVRIPYPIDRWAGLLGFIQIEYAHVPQYVGCFMFGLLCYEKRWLTRLSTRVGYVWLTIGLLLAMLRYFAPDIIGPYLAKGGSSLHSLISSTFDSFLCVGLCVGLLILFREKVQHAGPLLRTMAQNTFAVYLIHVPVLVTLQYAFGPVAWAPIPKFLLVTFLGIVLSFSLSQWVLRRIPTVKRILF